MTCPKCNATVVPGAVFCATCGASLSGGGLPGGMQMPPAGYPGVPGQMGQMPYGPGYGYNAYGQPMMMVPQRTSGLAIAGFVLSLVFCGLLGLIFSIMGKNEIARSGGTVGGGGFATAGMVISIIRLVLEVLYIVLLLVAFRTGVDAVTLDR